MHMISIGVCLIGVVRGFPDRPVVYTIYLSVITIDALDMQRYLRAMIER